MVSKLYHRKGKKTHHILHFIAMNLICLSFFGQMPLITMCVLNILNVLKRPYANPVNAVCMRNICNNIQITFLCIAYCVLINNANVANSANARVNEMEGTREQELA